LQPPVGDQHHAPLSLLYASATALGDNVDVNTKLILLGAMMVGTLVGYAWSSLSSTATPGANPAPAASALPAQPATASIAPVSVASAEDRAWSSRGTAASAGPTAARQRAVEQSVYYTGCNEVRALGKAPLYAGQPGYRVEMDGDSDGIACEPIRNH